MLSAARDFAAVTAAGSSRSHPLLVARFRRTDLSITRFGLATGRRLGGAVRRNRARRRIRAVLRAMSPAIKPGFDVLIVARPPIVEADHADLVGALTAVLTRADVIGEPRKG